MLDWKQIVRKKFRVLGVCSPEWTEELAGHLEDIYEAFLRGGAPPEAAFDRTVMQVNRRSEICLTLRILQEVLMTDFARNVGLPGLLTFALSMGIDMALEMAHVQPKTILLGNGLPLSLPPIAWLCLLPFCGAAGALVSHRSGGSRLQRIAACLFPSAIMAAVLLIIFVAGFAISLFVPDSGWNWALAVPALALWLTGQAILTAVPLLLGAVAGEQMKRVRLLT
ncbi:MAG: hypothetical protein ACXVK3_12115 [Candidatus Angelobacter sp.]